VDCLHVALSPKAMSPPGYQTSEVVKSKRRCICARFALLTPEANTGVDPIGWTGIGVT
jgi:hypothetical protein